MPQGGDRLPFMPIEVYQFEWNGGIWYYIHDPLNSCLLCDIYDRDGNNIDQYEDSLFRDHLEPLHIA